MIKSEELITPQEVVLSFLEGRCNLSCKFCAERFLRIKDHKICERAFDEIERLPSLRLIHATNGEFLHQIRYDNTLRNRLERLHRKFPELSYSVLTNLTLEHKNWELSIMERTKRIVFTFFTLKPQMYRHIAGLDLLSRVLKNISFLQSYRKKGLILGVNIVVMRCTIRELRDLIRFLTCNCDEVLITPVRYNLDNQEFLKKQILKDDELKYIQEVSSEKWPKGLKVNRARIIDANKVKKFLSQGDVPPCRLIWERALIYVNGEVCPCCSYRDNFGNILKQGLVEIYNGEKAQKARIAFEHKDYSACNLSACLRTEVKELSYLI